MARKMQRSSTPATTGRTVACPICNVSPSKASDLPRHMRTHTAEFPFACPVPGCLYATRQKSNLETHKNTHTGNRPHVCVGKFFDERGVVSRCAAAFSDPSGLVKHRRLLHGKKGSPPKFRALADQLRDQREYALAIEFKMKIKEVRMMLKAMKEDPSAAPSSSSSSSSSFNLPAPSAVKPEPVPSPTIDLLNLAPITDFGVQFDSSSFNCNFGAPSPPLAPVNTWVQPQPQNFADILNQPNLLLPSQVPTQYFGGAANSALPPLPQVEQPAMGLDMRGWQFDLNAPGPSMGPGLDMNVNMNTGMGMGMGPDFGMGPNFGLGMNCGMGMDMGMSANMGMGTNMGTGTNVGANMGMGSGTGMPDPLTLDMPPRPLDPLCGQPTMDWSACYTVPSPSGGSSIASSPSVTGMTFDFLRQSS